MFAVRRIFRNRKTLSNCISTSSAVQCEKSKSNKESNAQERKEDSKSNKADSSKEKIFENLFSRSTEPKKSQKSIKFTLKSDKEQKPEEPSGAKFRNDIFQRVLVSSVEKVAEDLGGDKIETKKDLLGYIKTFEVTKEPSEPSEEAENVEKQFLHVSFNQKRVHPDTSLRRLNIFKLEQFKEEDNKVQLNTWDTLEKEELEFNSLTSPRNHFEELIQWTNEGKLWRFPIDNDQGLEKEAQVSFTEHIFLEQYLEPWCPKKGPLRRFMELVLIGLSKNPYLTVQDKKDHIHWFKDYFENKKKLLQELGAVGATKEIDG